MDEIVKTCPDCLGYGEIPVRGASGQWELMSCPKCQQQEEPQQEPNEPVLCVKDEVGKVKMELLLDMPEQLERLGEILTFGISKYPQRMGWETRTQDQYRGALLRHLLKYRKGERLDKETGLPHILHVAINCMFIDYLDDKDGKTEKA